MTTLEELLTMMAEDAARTAKPEKRPPPVPPPKKAEAIAVEELESLDDGPVLKDGQLWPSALPRPARRGPPPPPGRRARGTEPLAPDNVTSGLIDVRAMAMAYAAQRERGEAAAPAAPPPAEDIIKVELPAPKPEPPAPKPEAAPKPVMAEGTRPIPVVEEPVAEPALAEAKREDTDKDKERRAGLWLLVARRAAVVVALGGVAALAVTLLSHRGRSDDDAAALPEEEATAVRIEPEPAAAVAVAPAEVAPEEIAPAEVAPAIAAEPAPEPVVIAQPTTITEMEKAEPSPAAATDEVIRSATAETPQPAVARAEEPAERPGPSTPPPELLADGCFDAACAATARQVRRPEPPATAVITAPARLPTRPSNSEIASAIFAAQDQIAGCGDVYGTSGAVPLKLRIAASGAITSVAVGEGTTQFRTCVTDIVRQLRMPASLIGMTASFPVLIR